jgi:hypothetical protein
MGGFIYCPGMNIFQIKFFGYLSKTFALCVYKEYA